MAAGVTREPFPRAGQRLNDAPERPGEPARRSVRPISIFGGIGYAPGYPSRWAGKSSGGTTRLTVDDHTIVLTPLAFLRKALRLPVVRIPLDEVETASEGPFGWSLRFHTAGDPKLDGMRFYAFGPNSFALRPLIELLRSRGVTIETPPASRRWTLSLRDGAVGLRPGWIFRDRGHLGFVESFIVLGVGALILYFQSPPHLVLVVFGAIAALYVVSSIVGHRIRRRATQRD
jgi:hypothetical protein